LAFVCFFERFSYTRIWPIYCQHIGAAATALRPGSSPHGPQQLRTEASHQLDPRMMAGRSGQTFIAGE
jgi:hypothetical protein